MVTFSRSRGLGLALLLWTSLGQVALIDTLRDQRAFADEEEDEDSSDEGGGDEGGDDEGGGGDDEGGEEEDEDAKDQPPVTSGGLFTLASYPVREISRPLSMTEKILQIRVGGGTDISAKGAFESFGLSAEVVYGVRDNVAVIGGFTNAYNFKQFGAYIGIETALAYDLANFRLAANIHRNALPIYKVFCNPPTSKDEMPDPGTGMCSNMMQTQDNLPSGDYEAGNIKFSLDLGFPFRYAIRPEVAIVALHTLMSIDFNSAKKDYVIVAPIAMPTMGGPKTEALPKPNGAKPDLNPSLGIATNPVAPLSVVIFAQLRIPDFDTSAGAFQVPVTGRIQFSPNQKLDLGLEFTLLNVKPPEGQSPIDNRFLALFLQTRVGR